MIADSKTEAQAQGLKMIEQAKSAIESEKKQLCELKLQVSTLSLSIAENY
jgi:F-type H+-transporting ATPase subunit b